MVQQHRGMCVVNREIVDDLATLAATSADMMQRLGISWNSWIKIVAGQPIRRSLALRFRDRILEQAASIEGFRQKFPSASSDDGIDRMALERAFLCAPCDATPPAPAPRSLRQALTFASSSKGVYPQNGRIAG